MIVAESGSTPPRTSVRSNPWFWSSSVLALIILGCGIWTAISTARIVGRTYTPVTYWDQWTVVNDLVDFHGMMPLWRLWAQHNEHRIPVGRLAVLADLKVFGGRNVSLLIEVYCVQLCLALLFLWMCRYFGEFRGRALITAGGFFLFCAFCHLQIENFYWGFQIAYVFAGLAAAVSFSCIIWHASKIREGMTGWISAPLLLAFLAGLLSECSLADGLLVWPIIVWLCFSLRLPKQTQILSAIVGLTAIAVYFVGYQSPPEHSNPWIIIRQPLSLAKYVITYFASTWDASLPSYSPWPTFFESLTVLAFVYTLGMAAWYAVRKTPPGLLEAFLISNLLLTMGAALLTSLGRLRFGLTEATTSRYQSIALVFWASLAAIILDRIPKGEIRNLILTVSQAGLLLLLIGTEGRLDTSVRLAERHQTALGSAFATLANTPTNLEALKPLHPSTVMVPIWYHYMRSHNLGPDPREFYNWGGYTIAADNNCTGTFDVIQSVSPDREIAQGWAWDLTVNKTPRRIILTLPGGVVVGFGDLGTPRPDVQAVKHIPDPQTGWSGEVQAPRGSRLRAFAVLADSKWICPLNGELEVH